MSRERTRLIRAMDAQIAQLDALVLPTTPIVAPTIAEMEDSNTFNTKNMLLLRNTSTWNFFDNCAISLPIPGSGLPVGLMLVGRNGHDRRLFEIAAGIERLFVA
jgi:aspartyl-tRNA(Asn)/glutamyl-tRNA(Gln) amidotransferase subunit A